jgi:hypothetical protein
VTCTVYARDSCASLTSRSRQLASTAASALGNREITPCAATSQQCAAHCEIWSKPGRNCQTNSPARSPTGYWVFSGRRCPYSTSTGNTPPWHGRLDEGGRRCSCGRPCTRRTWCSMLFVQVIRPSSPIPNKIVNSFTFRSLFDRCQRTKLVQLVGVNNSPAERVGSESALQVPCVQQCRWWAPRTFPAERADSVWSRQCGVAAGGAKNARQAQEIKAPYWSFQQRGGSRPDRASDG